MGPAKSRRQQCPWEALRWSQRYWEAAGAPEHRECTVQRLQPFAAPPEVQGSAEPGLTPSSQPGGVMAQRLPLRSHVCVHTPPWESSMSVESRSQQPWAGGLGSVHCTRLHGKAAWRREQASSPGRRSGSLSTAFLAPQPSLIPLWPPVSCESREARLQGLAHSFVVCTKCRGRWEQVSLFSCPPGPVDSPFSPRTPSPHPAPLSSPPQVRCPQECTYWLLNHSHPGFSRQE